MVIQLAPGSLPAYIGPNFAVDENSGFALVEGTTLQFRLRPDDELWAIGTDPTTSSKIQMIVQSVGQPS
ncbi:hypothetical protein A5784_14205 [Mycobacterium sp. 852013-50091_SCH5140682]|nr:hypothetical protein A5784_14205 [Mycobacterium sp. 852013-50091_SCH5140682]